MTKPKLNKEARERLRQFLVEETCCCLQGPEPGWPCGTCFIYWLNKVGLSSRKKEYKERNKEHDRHNEVWRAILQIRDAK